MYMKANHQEEWRQAHIKKTLLELGITQKDYTRFLRIGNKLHQIYEMSCNGHTGNEPIYAGNKIINEYTDELYQKDTDPLYAKGQQIAHDLGLYIYFQTDPRGATIYLDKKPIPDNNYNRSYCIY